MAATRLIAMHLNKGRSIGQCIKDRTDYAQNPEKTDGGQLISSYECDPKLVEEQFALAKREYLQKTGRRYKGDVIAYQIRQAFKPGEITPEATIQGRNVKTDKNIPWYGPLYLNGHYGVNASKNTNIAPMATGGVYTVKKGDTLSAIARRLNTTVDYLVKVNNIVDRDKIREGQILKY